MQISNLGYFQTVKVAILFAVSVSISRITRNSPKICEKKFACTFVSCRFKVVNLKKIVYHIFYLLIRKSMVIYTAWYKTAPGKTYRCSVHSYFFFIFKVAHDNSYKVGRR